MKRPKKKESFKLKEYDEDHNGLMSYTRDSIIDLLNEYALLTSKLFRKMHYNMSLSLYNYNSIKGSSIVTIENRKECIGFVSPRALGMDAPGRSPTSAKVQKIIFRCKLGGEWEQGGSGRGLTDFFLTNVLLKGREPLRRFMNL